MTPERRTVSCKQIIISYCTDLNDGISHGKKVGNNSKLLRCEQRRHCFDISRHAVSRARSSAVSGDEVTCRCRHGRPYDFLPRVSSARSYDSDHGRHMAVYFPIVSSIVRTFRSYDYSTVMYRLRSESISLRIDLPYPLFPCESSIQRA